MSERTGPPRATIIIPLRRQSDVYLGHCVRSALAQTITSEVIVVVAANTPERNLATLQRIQDDAPALRIIVRERDSFADAFNTGIKTAAADRIGFLLSDDWLDPTAVEECIRRDADIVSTDIEFYAADGSTKLELRPPHTAEKYASLTTLLAKASFLSYFYLFKKPCLKAVGGVDETAGLTGPDDLDLIWSLLEHGATVSVVEKKLYNCRDHDGERLTLRDRDLQIADLKKILDKHSIVEPERERIVRHHARWYGRTLLEVVQERGSIPNVQ
ncbi:MAG: glycosyltransferase family 2 protein [Alphaproteobacteria bacterium]|nr:glycosyltransferase family 2 protein [Alphaproteobacteria bacterium]